jgi:hypothetical protein
MKNASLYRLVYVSRNEIEGDEVTIQSEIEQILTKARTQNPLSNITGALLFNTGCFAQILEGLHDDIQETFERIQCDRRHSHVAVLAFEPIAERKFTNWSMAYFGTDSKVSGRFADIIKVSGFDSSKLSGDRITELLQEHLLDEELALF